MHRFLKRPDIDRVTAKAHIAAVRAALPPGALLGTPQSYLAVEQQASTSIAPWVPFIVAFGVIALVMPVLIVINVISGAVVGGTRRIGVLKSIGFTPLEVVAAYVLQVAIPALVGSLARSCPCIPRRNSCCSRCPGW